MRSPYYCAPGVRNNNGTCMDRRALTRYIQNYNMYHSNDPIALTLNEDDQQLIRSIRQKLKVKCGAKGDWCWIDQDFAIGNQDLQKYYKPKMPSTQYKWLTTSDIDDVLRQYETIYSDFKYLGAVPLDFDQLNGYQLSREDYCMHYNQDGKTKVGAVFNLDTHDQRGSHWVALFFDLTQHYIAFFDSVGVSYPPKEIMTLIDNVKARIERCQDVRFQKYLINRNLDVKINHRRIQKGNTECGVFCIYFILKCLAGYSPDRIFNDPKLSDQFINRYRATVFRPSANSDNQMFIRKYGWL